jgi:hypothetical protein
MGGGRDEEGKKREEKWKAHGGKPGTAAEMAPIQACYSPPFPGAIAPEKYRSSAIRATRQHGIELVVRLRFGRA